MAFILYTKKKQRGKYWFYVQLQTAKTRGYIGMLLAIDS